MPHLGTLCPHALVTSAGVASLPDAALRVNEMVDDPACSALDISRAITQDPDLTARLLRILNSTLYGFPSRIETVARAITVLGAHELRDLVLASSIVGAFEGFKNDLVTLDAFWRHSICCALVARTLANHCGVDNVEKLFLSGLLHDVGSLLMYAKVPDLMRVAIIRANQGGEPRHLCERDVMGFDHASVGGELLRNWALPLNVQEAVSLHHTPSLAEHYPLDTAITHLADIIANAMCEGGNGSNHLPPFDEHAWATSGLSTDTLAPTVTTVRRTINEMVRMLAH